jgi:protein gp37
MALLTGIEWTDSTWNPMTGCTKVSPGCARCYAERMARRLYAMGNPNYANGFKPTIHPDMLQVPLHWKGSHMVFVNSMGDLFHSDVPLQFIQGAFSVMRAASWHTFQVLTKRSERLLKLNNILDWPPNVWMGVSVENSDYAYRVDQLRQTDAHTKFLSLEPLLGPLPNLDLRGMDWVIVGGESGPSARPIAEEWVLDIRNQCRAVGVPFFFKQWGGNRRKANGRLLEGRTWDEMPRVAGRDGT